jgi:hypothetical protein
LKWIVEVCFVSGTSDTVFHPDHAGSLIEKHPAIRVDHDPAALIVDYPIGDVLGDDGLTHSSRSLEISVLTP